MPAFVRNTKTFFNQTTAPTGWTKITNSGDDYTLRLVNGSTGGSYNGLNGVSAAFVDSTWSATVSSITGSVVSADADLPSHQHQFAYATAISNGQIMISYPANPLTGQYLVSSLSTTTSGAAGSGSTHNHGIASGSSTIAGNPTGFNVKYIDFIMASKD